MVMTRRSNQSRELVHRGSDFFDRVFDDVPELFRRPLLMFPDRTVDFVRSDEFTEDGNLVVRIELAGIDPDKDVEISVRDDTLHIEAEQREEETTDGRDYSRHELHYRSFRRDLPVPRGTTEEDVHATYADGILEIKVPQKEEVEAQPKKVQISRGVPSA